MKRVYIIILLTLLMLIPIVTHADDLTQTEKNLYIGFVIFELADWRQTRYIAEYPDLYYETNPILGEHPSTDEVDRYFAACLLTNILVPYWLEHKIGMDSRLIRFYQILITSYEASMVYHNYTFRIPVF